MSVRRSSVAVLRDLPPVFDLSTFSRLVDVERDVAKTYLSRWSKSGLVIPAGPRAGIYYNAVAVPDASDRFAARALRMAYPSALVTGETVLHRAGWTTQIPHASVVAVLERRSYVRIDGFEIRGRTRDWYVAARAACGREPDPDGLPSVTPAFALADGFAHEDGWRPDPDDLDVDDDAWPDVVAAFGSLGAAPPEWLAEVTAVPSMG